MALLRVKMRWSGFNGGPGYSIFHFNDFGSEADGWNPQVEDAANVVAKVDAFATAIAPLLPNNARLNVLGEVEEINTATGELVDIHGVTAPPERKTSFAAGPYSAPVGAVVSWRSGRVHKGRRIRGRTFLVPLLGSYFENDGTLSASTITTINAAASGLMNNTATTGDLAIYSRPVGPGATDGAAGIVTSFNVPDMGAVLRSRR